jgi:pyruvate/2-oxoglutarate dehydrogenase complex dihydrolipoamide dehydrogenase (E3) component
MIETIWLCAILHLNLKNSHNNDGTALLKIEADLVVHGASREPNIDGLDLVDAGSVEYTRKGVKVNEYLQSVSNQAVYAAGDVAEVGAYH